ncbi:fumarylacetoacetate hydrolase family protein [Ferrimicrobium acidiphilum]|uniref:fumarylacetoacetate hydrolase family protein n=1 Tax=Ferrimicrobium acidiphilum TaxID=121039 RepID=UPI0023F2D20E|nr:fumarylacetoacetate hydrolase family protein [Ferrimicrobium acidiphilum]
MRFATVDFQGSPRAAIDFGSHYRVTPFQDLSEALRELDGDIAALADISEFETIDAGEAILYATTKTPHKIICLGLNFTDHVAEMLHDRPAFPTLFAKYALTLTDPYAAIIKPEASNAMDWEVEIGVVIGKPARDVSLEHALDHVAGYTVVNDVSFRDFQNRTSQFLQGKIFERTTPVGPWLVTRDEVDDANDLAMTLTVNGELMQSGRSSQMIFGIAETIVYLSRILTLEPGDLLSMGTPSGVGAGRTPQRFLVPGEVMESSVEGIGVLTNRIISTGSSTS